MGFSAFILLSSAIASMGGILGITLPFFVYTGASTVLSFLLGPAGFSLIFMGISGQSIWRGNERIQRERMGIGLIPSNREYRQLFGITNERMLRRENELVIMHPGPMNRGIEIDTKLADDINKSVIKEQVELGVAVRMACLKLFCE